jgi:DNA (cytosine-5)-methyltransferase 1
MKYLDLFAGYGGFSLGIQQAYDSLSTTERKQQGRIADDMPSNRESLLGAECVGFSEIDKYATQVYKKHFNHKEYGDITKIDPSTLPDFNLLVGGFPCQAFSVAGKRAGFEDTRGTLIFDVLRILKEKRPRWCLLENVKGLLSHDNGRTFKTIITSLAELGYAVEWQVLNAKNFGVPQNRERVFIIGHLGGFSGRQVFPIGGEHKACNGELAKTIMARDYKVIGNQEMTLVEKTENQAQGYRVYDPNGISTTLAGQAGGIGAKTGLYAVASRGRNPENPSDRTTGSPTEQRLEPNTQGTSNTLTNVQKDNWLSDGKIIRRLTPTECERLMGLPDGWTAEGTEGKISDTQRYKLCGNGVVVNVVEEIIKRLLWT